MEALNLNLLDAPPGQFPPAPLLAQTALLTQQQPGGPRMGHPLMGHAMHLPPNALQGAPLMAGRAMQGAQMMGQPPPGAQMVPIRLGPGGLVPMQLAGPPGMPPGGVQMSPRMPHGAPPQFMQQPPPSDMHSGLRNHILDGVSIFYLVRNLVGLLKHYCTLTDTRTANE